MEIVTNATLLTAESKPYEIDGNKGISHKARFLIGGEIFKVNATADQVVQLNKSSGGSMGELTLNITSPKENVKVSMVSFE